MKRRVRTPYYPRCNVTAKVRYPTVSAANKARSLLMRSGRANRPLKSYYCMYCQGFHIGTNTDKDS